MTTPYDTLDGQSPFPPDSFGIRLGAPLTVELSTEDLFSTPAEVPASGTLESVLLDVHDFNLITFGFSAPSDLSVSIQPYLDHAGAIPAGSATTIAASTGGVATLPTTPTFRSLVITFSNAGTSPVTITKSVLVARPNN